MTNSTKAKAAFAILTALGWLSWLGLTLFNSTNTYSSTEESLNKDLRNIKGLKAKQSISTNNQLVLLESLLALKRFKEAKAMLETLILKEPNLWMLSIIYIEIARHEGNTLEAQKEITRIRKIHPDNLQLMKIKALIDFEQSRGGDSIAMLRRKFEENKVKSARLSLGLLLADLLQKTGKDSSAKELYLLLSKESPKDTRALLGLSELKQQQGKYIEALRTLGKVRNQRTKLGESDSLIDGLAEEWGLKAAKKKKI